MSDFKVVYTSAIQNVSEVRLYDETLKHIAEEHPEVPIALPSMQEAVLQTVVNPTQIEKGHSNTYVYINHETTNKAGDPFRVPVRVISTEDNSNSGRICTAFFSTSKPSAVVVWKKPQ